MNSYTKSYNFGYHSTDDRLKGNNRDNFLSSVNIYYLETLVIISLKFPTYFNLKDITDGTKQFIQYYK